VKREDDSSDNTKENFPEAQEKSNGSLGNKLNTKKQSNRCTIRDPYLGHAAGDYEPIQEDSRFHVSEDPERIVGKPSKERRFMQRKLEEQHRVEKIGTLHHDRQ
jgi:hypothetical protein